MMILDDGLKHRSTYNKFFLTSEFLPNIQKNDIG
jgi:hypothetical protein